jgi:NADH:ubiquinone oxidoreductase subunit H
VVGLGIVTAILTLTFLGIKYNIRMPSRDDFGIFVWVALTCLFVAYMLLRFILGRKRADDLTSAVLEKLVGICRRVSGNA